MWEFYRSVLVSCVSDMSGNTTVNVLLIGLMGYNIIKKRRRRNRTKWIKNWLSRKELHHMPLLKHMQEDDPDDYKNYLRMDDSVFMHLLSLVKSKLTKKDTVMRTAISPEERLSATLRYLASGRYYKCSRFSVGIAYQTLGYVIPETCRVLYEVLSEQYMKVRRKNVYTLLLTYYFIMKCNQY